MYIEKYPVMAESQQPQESNRWHKIEDYLTTGIILTTLVITVHPGLNRMVKERSQSLTWLWESPTGIEGAETDKPNTGSNTTVKPGKPNLQKPGLPAQKFIRPTSARVTSKFGYRIHPILGYKKLHTGIDFGANQGEPVVAAASGRVIVAGVKGGYGNTVMIKHDGGVSTLYGHNSRLLVKVGDEVKQGDVIAEVGSTGLSTAPHCHFEVRLNGQPVDPTPYLEAMK